MLSSPKMSADYLTKKEFMAYLKISRTTVDRLMQQGLPYIKLERRVLFRRSEIDAFLESKTVRKAGVRAK